MFKIATPDVEQLAVSFPNIEALRENTLNLFLHYIGCPFTLNLFLHYIGCPFLTGLGPIFNMYVCQCVPLYWVKEQGWDQYLICMLSMCPTVLGWRTRVRYSICMFVSVSHCIGLKNRVGTDIQYVCLPVCPTVLGWRTSVQYSICMFVSVSHCIELKHKSPIFNNFICLPVCPTVLGWRTRVWCLCWTGSGPAWGSWGSKGREYR